MTIEGKLNLDSTRWSDLDSFVESGQIPGLIREVEESEDPGASDAFGELLDAIYQQYTCCEATCAALPFLVETGLRLESNKNPDLWINVGQIAGTCADSVCPGDNDLTQAYKTALEAAQRHWIDVLLDGSWDIRTLYYLCVSAIALTRNPLGKLFMDNIFPDKYAESMVVCPLCTERIVVAVFPSGLVVRPKGSKRPEPPSPPLPFPPPRIVDLPSASPNPWQAIFNALNDHIDSGPIPRDITEHLHAASKLCAGGLVAHSYPGLVFSLLGSVLVLKGHSDAGMRYLHAWDSITCPTCGAVFMFAERWWGVVE